MKTKPKPQQTLADLKKTLVRSGVATGIIVDGVEAAIVAGNHATLAKVFRLVHPDEPFSTSKCDNVSFVKKIEIVK